MTPKQALQKLRDSYPESEFVDAYFVHDDLWIYMSSPKNAKPSESIGQVYFYDPKTESFGPYAPYGKGMDEFHRWCESASNVVHLRGDGGLKKQPANSLSNSRM